MLETSAFKGDNKFLEREKPEPDPAGGEKFRKYLFEGREPRRKHPRERAHDRMALFALAQSYGLQANYQFMSKRATSRRCATANARATTVTSCASTTRSFVDGYLVAGVQEYVVGCLPWALAP